MTEGPTIEQAAKAKALRRRMLELEGLEFEVMTIRAKVEEFRLDAVDEADGHAYELRCVTYFLREALRAFDQAHRALVDEQLECTEGRYEPPV